MLFYFMHSDEYFCALYVGNRDAYRGAEMRCKSMVEVVEEYHCNVYIC